MNRLTLNRARCCQLPMPLCVGGGGGGNLRDRPLAGNEFMPDEPSPQLVLVNFRDIPPAEGMVCCRATWSPGCSLAPVCFQEGPAWPPPEVLVP